MDELDSFDLIVIGGGPGGSTLAALVAMQGHRVLLLEREKFPRYQIGESLLPSTVLGVSRLLGIKEELDSAGFQRKGGGTFLWGKSPEPWSFSFNEEPQLGTQGGYAYQVERSKFDNMLLMNAKRRGVDVREETMVLDLIQEDGRFVAVRFADSGGAKHTARGRFIADASGNTSGLHKHVGERVFSKFFQNVALFGYFKNGKRQPAPWQGNITCAAFKRGWFWYIPLSDEMTSVGAVIAKSEADLLKGGHEEALQQFISECPLIQDYLSAATRIKDDSIYGKLRVRKDYSYHNTSFWKPGLMLVGDAACFIDPLFSSGVHLATYSALLAARSVNTLLAPGASLDEATCFSEYERRYRREFGLFYQFLVSFYDIHHDKDSYFWMARKVLGSEEMANEAFVRLVAGVASQDFFQTCEKVSSVLATSASQPTTITDEHFREFDSEFFKEQARMMWPGAVKGDSPTQEAPLFSDGLAPSSDGLHWIRSEAAATVGSASASASSV